MTRHHTKHRAGLEGCCGRLVGTGREGSRGLQGQASGSCLARRRLAPPPSHKEEHGNTAEQAPSHRHNDGTVVCLSDGPVHGFTPCL
jgi:hypothetical protein